MITRFIEARSEQGNWGKFMVGVWDREEWSRPSGVGTNPNRPLLAQVGWGDEHVLVYDLQTGEGGVFRHGGYAKADLDKHRIWVCPLFEPFLTQLYEQRAPVVDGVPFLDEAWLLSLPDVFHLDVPLQIYGYRRSGLAAAVPFWNGQRTSDPFACPRCGSVGSGVGMLAHMSNREECP